MSKKMHPSVEQRHRELVGLEGLIESDLADRLRKRGVPQKVLAMILRSAAGKLAYALGENLDEHLRMERRPGSYQQSKMEIR